MDWLLPMGAGLGQNPQLWFAGAAPTSRATLARDKRGLLNYNYYWTSNDIISYFTSCKVNFRLEDLEKRAHMEHQKSVGKPKLPPGDCVWCACGQPGTRAGGAPPSLSSSSLRSLVPLPPPLPLPLPPPIPPSLPLRLHGSSLSKK